VGVFIFINISYNYKIHTNYMNTHQEEIFSQRKEEVSEIIGHISAEKQNLEIEVGNPKETLVKLKREGRDIAHYLFTQAVLRLHDTKFLEKSPFFVRLSVQFDDKSEPEKIYIGKFSFLPDKIYSWTAPVAGLRFNTPGEFSYTRPNGQKRSGVLVDREDYFISNGKIVSLYGITEKGRDLIYDEYISTKKTGFGLSDIVRELERAQNDIIILDPKGQMVISGPAGSGKTTLALHRVAYLLQNPDTSEVYKPENTIIFIQDENSIEYFSSLFVNLGVEGVRFTTFEKWCVSVLGLAQEYEYIDRYGDSSLNQDWYEWNKVEVIKNISKSTKYLTDPWKTLEGVYGGYSNTLFQKMWKTQKDENILDKQDLTVLLKIQAQNNGEGKVYQPSRVWKKKAGKMVPMNTRAEVAYDTLLVDEFENYTADQLQILNTTLSSKSSCLFVGDINQKTRFGSISNFSESSISISENRNIVLNKVYRNSAAVLEMLTSLGYIVNSDNKNAMAGSSQWINNSATVIDDIKEYLKIHKDEQVGVICYDADRSEIIKDLLVHQADRVHIGSVKEFQGLEFDTVFILDVNKDLFIPSDLDAGFDKERSQILREQLYVAITRARSNVVVYSDSAQQEIKGIF